MKIGLTWVWIWAGQGAIFAFSGITAFLLQFDLSVPHAELDLLFCAVPVWVVVKSLVFRIGQPDRGWWRLVSQHDVPRLAMANVAGSMAAAAVIVRFAPHGFPRSIYVLDLLVCLLMTAAARLAAGLAARVEVSCGGC